MTTAKGLAEQFAFVALISWAFLLRVPSECLLLARLRAGKDVLFEERLERKAVTGLVGKKLIINLRKKAYGIGAQESQVIYMRRVRGATARAACTAAVQPSFSAPAGRN